MAKDVAVIEKTEVIKLPEEGDLSGFLQTLIDSKSLPSHVKTLKDAFTIVQMGKELGFAPMMAMHYIIPIQGKLSLSAKAIGALLRRGGIEFVTAEDGVLVFKDGTVSSLPKDDEKPVDRRTTIKFYRGRREEICSFTWKDAEKQGLTTKDNWIRMPREMLYARCLAKGANRVGQDLLMGLYTTEELADTMNLSEQNIVRSDEGLITEIKS